MPGPANDYRVFFADTPRALRPVVTALRAMVRATAPGLVEIMRHGMPNYAAMEDRYKPTLVYIMSASDHVNLGFYDGVFLKDPGKRLEGTGKRLRHAKVYTVAQARDPALKAFVKDALRVHATEALPKRSR